MILRVCLCFRSAHYAGRSAPAQHVLPLQPVHERGRGSGRESRGEAGADADGGSSVSGEKPGETPASRRRTQPRQEKRPETERVAAAPSAHVRELLQDIEKKHTILHNTYAQITASTVGLRRDTGKMLTSPGQ